MYLGIEIGGSKLQAALGLGDGTLQRVERVAARPREGRAGICEQLRELTRRILEAAGIERDRLAGVGIGFGGPVDSTRGLVTKSHQVAGWDDFPLVEWFQRELGLRAALANDSDLAGLAEAHFGAGRGKSPLVYMNIGSGIGGAIVLDGRLLTGQGKGSAEIGHFRLRPAQPGRPWRTLESLASGWSLAEAARQAADAHPDSTLWRMAGGKREAITTEILVLAVRQNDSAASQVWAAATEHWGVVIANVITLLCPARVVLGGGVSLVGDLLFESLRAEVGKQVFAPFAQMYDIVPAQLAEEVVLHGALKLARDRGETSSP